MTSIGFEPTITCKIINILLGTNLIGDNSDNQ